MRVQQIDADVHIAIGDAYDSNSTIVLNGKDALLIETMATRKDAQELKDFVEGRLEKKVRFIVSTHYFSDHLAGLKLFPHSQIVAHKNYRHTFDSELHRSDEEKSNFVEPTMLISDEMILHWGRYNLHLFYNPGHTMSTINVDIPEADLIHVGDTLVGNTVYMKYSSPLLFSRALQEIRRRGRTNLISSHGNVRAAAAVDHASYYLESLQRLAAKGWQEGSEEAISNLRLNDCLPSGVEGTPFENIFHKRNLQSIVERRLFEAV